MTRSLVRLPALVSCAALAIALIAAGPADARTAATRATPKAARTAPKPAPQAPIICTKYGCNPLPRGCHAETEFTWEGPTGYQFIVCP